METKKTYDELSVNSIGIVFARKIIVTKKNGEILNKKYHRISISPMTDISKYDENVRAFCEQVWTDEIMEKFNQATQMPKI